MHKTLLRQLKKTLGLSDEEALQQFTAATTQLATGQPLTPELLQVLTGLGELVERISGAYDQYDRDLALRTRSLELSSAELTESNKRLQSELASREHALVRLRETAKALQEEIGFEGGRNFGDNLDDLIEIVSGLVQYRHESQKAIHEAHRALEAQKFALDQHAIVSITDPTGKITYANDKFCEISGYSRDELVGQNHRIIKSERHSTEYFRAMWRTIAAGQVWTGEVQNRAKDGRLYWVAATIVPFLDEKGKPYQYVGIRTDITERYEANEKLKEQLHFVEELIEAIPLPIYVKDTERRYRVLNPAFETFFGINRSDFIDKTVAELLPPDSAAFHDAKDSELLRQVARQTYEAKITRSDGTQRDGMYYKGTLTQPDGSIAGLVGTISDITDRKAWEVETLRAKEAAEAASRAKSDFLANMSHEIRTPMNGILGMTELALGTELSQEQREYLGIVKSSTEALLTIINDVLDFSKIEAGKMQIDAAPFDLGEIVGSVLKNLSVRAQDKQLELACRIAPELPSSLVGDPGRLRQILMNLVGNAIKFTDKGDIIIRAELTEKTPDYLTVQFSVSDTGIGIPKEKQSEIFEAFTQEDTSITRKYGGTGLGLTISARLVSMMHGRIWVESEPGKGSTFHFTLRLHTQSDLQSDERGTKRESLKGMNALVIDDNGVNRNILGETLSGWEVRTSLASSGTEGIELIRHTEPAFDFVLLDAMMPGLDGFETAQAIAALPKEKQPTIIMLSSAGLKDEVSRWRGAGITSYVTKPVLQVELLDAILAALGPAPGVIVKKPAPAHAPAMASMKILVVEDHPVNQQLTIRLLGKWGHQSDLATNGEEALQMLKASRYDLVLMDMQMPVMDGIEATRLFRLREIGRRTPIVAMTANAMEGDRERCLDAGMDDYLSKPVLAAELLEKLQEFSPSTVAGQTAPPQFDFAAALANEDREIIEVVSDTFRGSFPLDIAAMRDALAQKDHSTLKRTAHSIKSNCAIFGATPMVEIARQIEHFDAPGNQAIDIPHLISKLEADYVSLNAEIEKLLKTG